MVGRLRSVVIDGPDIGVLADFYSELLGLKVAHRDDHWITLGSTEPRVCLQLAPDFVPPSWPEPSRPQQFHLDVAVDDIDIAEAQVLALGATRLPGGGGDFRVYADPAGHPFCLVF